MPYEYGVTTEARYLRGATPELSSIHPAKTDFGLNRSFSVFFNALATNPT
jgi:hypothetical protein